MFTFERNNLFPNRTGFIFESFGVKISVESDDKQVLNKIFLRLSKTFPNSFVVLNEAIVEHRYKVVYSEDDNLKLFKLFVNKQEDSVTEDESNFFNYLESKVRLTVAENAPDLVFIHAGVIAVNDQALIIPGSSFSGKTTLVKELILNGAVYYSDEYAVVDKDGYVHPFTKTLSVRGIIDRYQQVEQDAKDFGAEIGDKLCPVGMVLITRFEEKSKWRPIHLNKGEAILELVSHTISIRKNPKFVLKVLNKIVSRAIVLKGLRGEASNFSKTIIEILELNAK